MTNQVPLVKSYEQNVLEVVRVFLAESKAERAHRAVAVEANLERDLGIGSLEKAELFLSARKNIQHSFI